MGAMVELRARACAFGIVAAFGCSVGDGGSGATFGTATAVADGGSEGDDGASGPTDDGTSGNAGLRCSVAMSR